MEWFLKVVRDNYANFEGRARRQEYWMFFLVSIGISVALNILALIFGSISDILGGLVSIVGLLYSLAIFVPSIAVAVRRLHDTNRSGWMLLIGLIPLIGVIILIVFLATEGDTGPNQYGPDPKNPALGTTDHLVV
ncbi:MAG: DUF805 domain-containing protein [Saprospiraceae bacterium]